MIGPNRGSVTSLPSLPAARSEPAPLQADQTRLQRYSAPSTPSLAQTSTHQSDGLLPPPPAGAPPRRAAKRMESRQSLRLTWAALPEDHAVNAPTAPERRLQYTIRSSTRRSIWPLINLLCASVGRSFVSVAGGLLADGVRDDMIFMGDGNNTAAAVSYNATASALNVSRSAIAECATALTSAMNATSHASSNETDAAADGVSMCLTALNEALATTANQTASVQPAQAGMGAPPSFVPAGVLLGLGILLFCAGAGRFAWDTSKIDKKRAILMGSLSFSGFAGVVIGNSVAHYAADNNRMILAQAMGLPRLLGTYLIFLSIPKSFSTCELVRGDARLPYREFIRVQFGAWGPTVFSLYALLLNNPSVAAPIHEVLYSLALMMLIIANALSETNVARARAASHADAHAEHDAAPTEQTASMKPADAV